MSEMKNGGLDQYGAEPFEQQQFGTAGIEGVKWFISETTCVISVVVELLVKVPSVVSGDSFQVR